MFNAILSKQIFDQLMNGKVINKHELNNSAEFRENQLFTEIVGNLDDYQRQYEMSGYEFVQHPSFIYIREKTSKSEELKTDITMRACVLLLLVGKYITEQNYQLTKLTEKTGGLEQSDFDVMEEMSDIREIILKAGIKNGLYNAVKSVLVDRNIMLELPDRRAYILSDAGKTFFDEVIQSYQGRDV